MTSMGPFRGSSFFVDSDELVRISVEEDTSFWEDTEEDTVCCVTLCCG